MYVYTDRGITKKSKYCRLHQVVNSGIENCVNNKEFELEINTNLFAFHFQSTR